jgi:hypothetical protein
MENWLKKMELGAAAGAPSGAVGPGHSRGHAGLASFGLLIRVRV